MVKNLPVMRETWVQSLGQEDPLERGMAYPPQYPRLQNSTDTVVDYKPWARRVGHDWATNNANIKCRLYVASHMAKPNVSVGGHDHGRWLQGSKEYILITCSLWQWVIFDTWTMCWNIEVGYNLRPQYKHSWLQRTINCHQKSIHYFPKLVWGESFHLHRHSEC